MEKICDRVLRKIRDEKISPKPRWHFLIKDCFVWLFFLVSLIVGAVAFSFILYILLTSDWFLYHHLRTSFWGHLIVSMPYIWFAILGLFVAIAYYNFKYTKSGYRHETYFVLALSVAGSLILGIFFHTLGTGEKIESAVSSNLPQYERMICCSARRDIWNQPDRGFLGGEIMDNTSRQGFLLKDFGGFFWHVRKDSDTVVFEPVLIIAGEKVKVIGEKREKNVFLAREIHAWGR